MRRKPSLPGLLRARRALQEPGGPNLAGQIEGYMVKVLKEYRSGERKNESMNIVAKDLSNEDMADVSAYYAAIQVDVLPP
jgi:cytochrome c553